MDQFIFHEMTFTWLDGVTLKTDGGTMFGPVPKAVWGTYFPYNDNNQIPQVTDPILIQYQGKNYLIDTGLSSAKLNEKARRNLGVHKNENIEKSLAELKLTFSDIDVVLMTHMHNDHAAGLTQMVGGDGESEGELVSTYPNAVIYVQELELEDVQNPNTRTRNTYLEGNWRPVEGQIKTFSDRVEVAPGITMEHTGGHSRGHSIIRFEQNGETVLHLGDLLMSFVHTNPLWVSAVDDYPMESIEAKTKLMKEALKNDYYFVFYHDMFYRVAQYTKDGRGLRYTLTNTKPSPISITSEQVRMFKHE